MFTLGTGKYIIVYTAFTAFPKSLIYIIGWVLINPKIAPKLPPEQNRAPVPDWLAHVCGVYSRRALPALLMALAAPGKALQGGADGA